MDGQLTEEDMKSVLAEGVKLYNAMAKSHTEQLDRLVVQLLNDIATTFMRAGVRMSPATTVAITLCHLAVGASAAYINWRDHVIIHEEHIRAGSDAHKERIEMLHDFFAGVLRGMDKAGEEAFASISRASDEKREAVLKDKGVIQDDGQLSPDIPPSPKRRH